MEHLVQFAIGIDDERIKQSIEKNVEKEVISKITHDIESVIYSRSYYGDPKAPLKEMVKDKIECILEENKELILETASTKLAEKLARTKAGKAILEDLK